MPDHRLPRSLRRCPHAGRRDHNGVAIEQRARSLHQADGRELLEGRLPGKFRAADVRATCPGWACCTSSTFLPKHRVGNPGGASVLPVRYGKGIYGLVEDMPAGLPDPQWHVIHGSSRRSAARACLDAEALWMAGAVPRWPVTPEGCTVEQWPRPIPMASMLAAKCRTGRAVPAA